MKRITLVAVLSFYFSLLSAQVWLPVCKGVKLKNGNSSVLSMAYDSFTNKLFVAGDFDSLCHKFYNGGVSYDGTDWDTIWRVTKVAGHGYLNKMIYHSGYLYFGYESGAINKYYGPDPTAAIRLGDVNGAIYSLEYYNGDLYVGGNFSKITWYDASNKMHSVTAYNIARWDGTSWYAMGNGLTYQFNDSYVFALKEWNNELYAGGFFKNEYGHCIARWNGSQWLDTIPGFSTTTSQFGEDVRALEIYNGQLFAGGTFNRAGATATCSVAKWDSANHQWSGVGNSGCLGPVICLNEIDGRLWAGGYVGLVYWDDVSWHTVGFSTTGVVNVIEGYHGDIFVGGWGFSYADSLKTIYSRCFARLAPDSIAVSVTEPIKEIEQLSIYPNPVSDKLVIEKLPAYRTGRQIENYKLEIIDLVGRILLTTQDTQLKTEIDVSNLPKGIYLLRTKSKSSWQVSKFVKE